MLQFYNSWSPRVLLRDSICNGDQYCNSHVTFGRVHAVVQGLDGHPADRQPSLKNKQEMNHTVTPSIHLGYIYVAAFTIKVSLGASQRQKPRA